MANENEKNPSALEELRQLKRTDRIKSLDIHEPELKGFNAENIFHIDEEPEKKTLFGKTYTLIKKMENELETLKEYQGIIACSFTKAGHADTHKYLLLSFIISDCCSSNIFFISLFIVSFLYAFCYLLVLLTLSGYRSWSIFWQR